MKDVEKVVLNMIGSQSNQNQYNLFKMKDRWADIIGNNNAKHCGPIKLERRILTLQVDSSVWSNQFLYYKSQFIMQINAFMGTDYVKDIKFVLGKNYKRSLRYSHNNLKTMDHKLQIPSATKEEKEGLQLQFSYIKNDKVRNAVIGVEEKKLGLEKLCNERKIKKCPFTCFITSIFLSKEGPAATTIAGMSFGSIFQISLAKLTCLNIHIFLNILILYSSLNCSTVLISIMACLL